MDIGGFFKETIIIQKIKYIYLLIFTIAVVYSFPSCSSEEKSGYKKIKNNEMPKDEIHQKLKSVDPAVPSKENVDKSVVDKMKNLENELTRGSNDTSKMLEFADYMIAGHQIDKGIYYYNKILEINPNRDDILLQLAIVYSSQHKFSEAIDVTKRMLKINPNNQIALYNLGALNATIGEKEKAKTIWQSIVTKYPNSEMTKKAKQSLKRL